MAGRTPKARPSEAPLGRSLVASATTYGKDVGRIWRQHLPWQERAWEQYDLCPELRAAANWIANGLSRCVLSAGEVSDIGKIVASDNKVTQTALNELFAGADGQSSILAAFGLHLTVAGECFLVGRKLFDVNGKPVKDAIQWEVVGIHEMSVTGNTWSIKEGEGAGSRDVPLDDDDTVIRVWRPHPRKRMEADSPVKALLGTLTEIEMYSRHIYAQLNSRLAGAGVFFLPDSVEFPGVASEDKAASFMKLLGDNMTTPLSNPSDASALVPIIAVVSDESIDKIRDVITFWTPFDEKVIESRRAAVLRFCVGMDMPPEVIQGMTNGASSSGGTGTGASHWTAYQIAEEAIKLHIEPLLEVIVSSITVGYVRRVTEDPKSAIVYDTNPLKLQPDRSKEAMELFDRGLMSEAAMFIYNGFKDSDAADDEERKRWLATRMAGGSATPNQVAWAMNYLGLEGVPTDEGQEPVHPGSNQAPAPSLEDHPSNGGAPEFSVQRQALLTAASEPMVLRALERAGNRLRSRGHKPPDVPAYEVYLYADCSNTDDLLSDAWSMVPTVCAGLADADDLTHHLHAYVSALLATKTVHSRSTLSRYLEKVA